MQKREYKMLRADKLNLALLNQLGEKGWELILSTLDHHAIFKRSLI